MCSVEYFFCWPNYANHSSRSCFALRRKNWTTSFVLKRVYSQECTCSVQYMRNKTFKSYTLSTRAFYTCRQLQIKHLVFFKICPYNWYKCRFGIGSAIESLMITPVQRIPRYLLLLRSYHTLFARVYIGC